MEHQTQGTGGAAMNEYIGIDFHKQTSYITRMNEEGNILEQIKVKNRK
jgi:hypothetical protein